MGQELTAIPDKLPEEQPGQPTCGRTCRQLCMSGGRNSLPLRSGGRALAVAIFRLCFPLPITANARSVMNMSSYQVMDNTCMKFLFRLRYGIVGSSIYPIYCRKLVKKRKSYSKGSTSSTSFAIQFALPTKRLILYLSLRSYRNYAKKSGRSPPEFISNHDLEYRDVKRSMIGATARVLNRMAEECFRQVMNNILHIDAGQLLEGGLRGDERTHYRLHCT